MGKGMRYQRIFKYHVLAKLKEPLRIGGSFGDKNEILVHPVTGLPFIQASSISGVMRSYCEKNHPGDVDALFGSQAEDGGSRIRMTDARFLSADTDVKLEFRPHVAISPQTGTASKEKIKGTDKQGGHKFETLLIGAGAKVEFCCFVYADEDFDHIREVMMSLFRGFMNAEIQLGAQKSTGCGYLAIEKLSFMEYDMKTAEGRKAWMEEDGMSSKGMQDITEEPGKGDSNDLQILIIGKTEGELLVRGIAMDTYGGDNPDCANIQNSAGDYIVPGSSFKGVLRNRMSSIAEYLPGVEMDKLIGDAFGRKGNGKNDKGKMGDLRFFDTVIGNRKDNERMPARSRIRIDKFTGGVMDRAKFTEKNIAGSFRMEIIVKNTDTAARSAGLLLLALRDLAVGAFSVGSGANIGKGYLKLETIELVKKDRRAVVDLKEGQTKDGTGLISEYLTALKEVG